MSNYYDIDPQTHRWPLRRRLGFALMAFLPTVLLGIALSLGVAHIFVPRSSTVNDAAPILFYVSIVAQTIVLLVFGHLLLDHAHLSGQAKIVWAAFFLLAAPVAIPAYWILHVLLDDPGAPHRSGRIRVVDTCYAGDPHPEREVREDHVEVEHHPVTLPRVRRGMGIALVALIPLASTACEHDATASDSKETQIASRVEMLLARDPDVDARRIRVSADADGGVVLEGEVETLLAERAALSAARMTPGVRDVVDRVEIEPYTRSDDVLTSRLRKALALQPELHGVNALVAGGVAILGGEVAHPEHAKEARRVASSVRGVRRVVDRTWTSPPTMRASHYERRPIEAELM